MVRYLNTIPGVRTFASCQGTIGEGGPAPYRAQVGTTWPDRETFDRLCAEFDFSAPDDSDRIDTDARWTPDDCWGYFHPREGWRAPMEEE